jgi:uncharacterized protein YbaA (DUF1428 family)
MRYVDGFVVPVRADNQRAYREAAETAGAILKEYGATRVVECWADDVVHGKRTDFYRAVDAGADETVAFSWIEWPTKEIRDAGMARMMADPRMQPGETPFPFDMKRMIFGGFAPILDL